jgi:hypothetical protein
MRLFLADPAPTIHLVLTLAAMLTVFRLAIHLAGGDRFGFANCYSLATAQLLRRHCNSPVFGEISLTRDVVSSPVSTRTPSNPWHRKFPS